MSETQLDRIERKLDTIFERLEARLQPADTRLASGGRSAESEVQEILDRLQSVRDRLDTYDWQVRLLGDATFGMRQQVNNVAVRMDQISNEMFELKQRFNGLGESIRRQTSRHA